MICYLVEVLPPCMVGLSQIEEMLIAHACPIMYVYRKHGGQRGFKGHVLNLPQDIQTFLDHLPCNVEQLPILVLHHMGQQNTCWFVATITIQLWHTYIRILSNLTGYPSSSMSLILSSSLFSCSVNVINHFYDTILFCSWQKLLTPW